MVKKVKRRKSLFQIFVKLVEVLKKQMGSQNTGIGNTDPAMGEQHFLESWMHSIAFCSMTRT